MAVDIVLVNDIFTLGYNIKNKIIITFIPEYYTIIYNNTFIPEYYTILYNNVIYKFIYGIGLFDYIAYLIQQCLY